MIFAQGITGKMTQALGLSIAFSLLASLFVALTVVPLSTSLLFRSKKSLKSIAKAPEERQFAKAKAWYRKRLDWALHHRRVVLSGPWGPSFSRWLSCPSCRRSSSRPRTATCS